MNKKKIAIIAVPAVIVIIVFIILFKDSMINYFTGNKDDIYIYSGTAEADEINVSSEISGKIKEIKVSEGQNISAGDIVAIIDSYENSIKLEQSEISLKNARNELSKVNEGNRTEEIKAQQALLSQAEASVRQGEALLSQALKGLESAKINYEYRQKIFQNIKALYEAGAESKSSLDNAQNALDNARTALDNASISVENSKAQLEGLKAQMSASRQKLNLLTNGATESSKKTAQYGVDMANLNLELSKLILDKSKIISSLSGTVEIINYKRGEYVTPGSPVATILDLQNIYVKIYVPEKVLPILKIDKEVIVKSDILKDKTIKGKIVYISPEAEFTPMNIVTKKDREKIVFAVKVKILDNLEYIRPGMLLDVDLRDR